LSGLSRWHSDDDTRDYAELQAIERDGGPKLPKSPLARLIGSQAAPEPAERPQAALYRTHHARRRLLERRLREAQTVPILARHFAALLARIPLTSRPTQSPHQTSPQRSSFHAILDSEALALGKKDTIGNG
jgi:hypothetical protein